MSNKVLLVGWDAADWKIIQPLLDYGLMPATRQLIEGGVMANLLTLQPALSPMLWTSIATGKRPHKHGILGFAEPAEGGGIQPVTNLSRKTKAIWNILCQNGKKCNVVGWWPSHPAEPIDGVMVSNHYQRTGRPREQGWPVQPGTIHPRRLIETLADLRVHPEEIGPEQIKPFVPLGHTIDQTTDRRLQWIIQILADCGSIQSCATWLMENEPWDFMAVYFDAVDHFCHGYIKYHPPRLPWIRPDEYELFKNVVAAGYVFHDMMLARLLELAGEDTTVILISDHGFHPDHLRRQELPSEPAGPAAEHREHGIFVIRGPGIRQDELIHGLTLLDIAPTILNLFDLPVGQDMDGRVIAQAFEQPPRIRVLPSWDDVPGNDGQHPPGTRLDARQSDDAIEQLVALGYLDQPASDDDQAAGEITMELRYNLARSYIHEGRHGDAIPILAGLYRESPLEFRFGVQLAICLQALNYVDDLADLVGDLRIRWQKAAEVARGRMQEIAEIARERRHRFAMLDRERGKHDSDTGRSSAHRALDTLFSRAEVRVIKKVRGISRGNPSTLDYLDGWVAMSQGDYETALNLFLKAETTQSGSPGFHFHLGEAYRNLKNYDKAREQCQKVLEIDPNNASAWLGLARIHSSLFENEQGIEMARKALGLNFHLPPAHYCIGVCSTRLQKFDEAIQAFETAISMNPNFAEAHARLARIYGMVMHNDDTAKFHAESAAQLRHQRSQHNQKRILQDLPGHHSINYRDALPVFPKNTIKSRLGDQPVATAAANGQPVYVVSGLPRSGTSMMMQMLAAGGIEPLTDGHRQADESNPQGYYELEKIKQLPQCNDWLDEAVGRSIKVISPLIPHLPQSIPYRMVVMWRDLDEMLASQGKMLKRIGKQGANVTDDQLQSLLVKQHEFALARLDAHQVPWLLIDHAEAIAEPQKTARKVAEFLNRPLNIRAMSETVDTSLHRERKSVPAH